MDSFLILAPVSTFFFFFLLLLLLDSGASFVASPAASITARTFKVEKKACRHMSAVAKRVPRHSFFFFLPIGMLGRERHSKRQRERERDKNSNAASLVSEKRNKKKRTRFLCATSGPMDVYLDDARMSSRPCPRLFFSSISATRTHAAQGRTALFFFSLSCLRRNRKRKKG